MKSWAQRDLNLRPIDYEDGGVQALVFRFYVLHEDLAGMDSGTYLINTQLVGLFNMKK